MIYYLISDVNSYNHKNYGKKGDEVKIVAEFGRVKIVELLRNNNRFSVKGSGLSIDKIEKDPDDIVDKQKNKIATKKNSRR